MRSRLATCPTNAINTVHSYDPYILYQQSSGGHTSKSLSHYPRPGSLFLLPAPSIQLYIQSGGV